MRVYEIATSYLIDNVYLKIVSTIMFVKYTADSNLKKMVKKYVGDKISLISKWMIVEISLRTIG